MHRVWFRFPCLWTRILIAGLLCAATLVAQDKADDQKLADKSPPEAINLFADAASFQNNGAFELAAEEWEQFLKKYPQDPLTPKARHYAGVCQLQLKNLDKAATHFQMVLAAAPKFELAEDAYLNLGWCQFSLAQGTKAPLLEQALKTFQAYIDLFPNGKYQDQVWYFVGECRYQRGEKAEAIKAYRQFADRFRESSLRANGLYALGVTHEELQQYQEAGRVYDDYLKEFPKSDLVTEVRMRKAETMLQTGEVAAAEKLFGEVVQVPGFAAADFALSRQAAAAAKQEKFQQAGEILARLATQFPDSSHAAEAAIAAGRSFYTAKNYDDAATWFKKAVERGGKDAAEAAHWLCRIYLRNRESQKVVELAESVLGKGGDSPYRVHLLMDQGDALYEITEWRADSIEYYVKLVEEHPQHELAPQALYNAAFAALDLKRFDDAAKHAASWQEKYSQHRLLPDVKFIAAECQLLQGQHAEAEKAYADLIARHSDHPDAESWQVRSGVASYMQKKHADVIEKLTAARAGLKKPELVAEAQFLVGASHFELGAFAAAAQALEESRTAAPGWRQADETWLFLARAQRALEKAPEAIATLKDLIAKFPDSRVLDQAYYRLGESHDAAGEHAPAIAAYDEVLTKYPESRLVAYAAYGKGWTQLRAKQFPGAAETFTRVIEDPSGKSLAADAQFARAMAYRQLGKHREAVDDFTAFLGTNPEQPRHSDALYERGLAEVALENYSSAAHTFQTILEKNPKYPLIANVLYELAWAQKKQGKGPESAEVFARLAKEHGDSPFAAEASFHVGDDLYERKKYAEAVDAYASARQKSTGELAEKAIYKLGWSYFKLEQFDKASAQFTEQVAQFGDGPLAGDANFMKAESLYKLGQYAEAWPAFQAATGKLTNSPDSLVLALLHGGQSAAQLQQWQDSVRVLDELAAKFADSVYLAEALYERGWAKQNLKQLDDALADYEQAANRSRNEVGARARFMMGEIQFERRQHAEAIKNFLRVMYGYGGENAPEEVKTWQATAAYEAGRCAEVLLQSASDGQRAKLLQDTKSYYAFVAEKHPRHKMAAQAKERLAALAKLN